MIKILICAMIAAIALGGNASAQSHRSAKTVVKGGQLPAPDTTRVKTQAAPAVSSATTSQSDKTTKKSSAKKEKAKDSAKSDVTKDVVIKGKKLSKSERKAISEAAKSHTYRATLQDLFKDDASNIGDTVTVKAQGNDTLTADSITTDSLGADSLTKGTRKVKPLALDTLPHRKRFGLFSDSTSLSKVCWISTVLPGYGQIYNKQYWKLPVLYATVGTSLALYFHENSKYRPLKKQYDALIATSTSRTPELDAVQASMIRSNTRRQVFLFTSIASYIFFIGDAAVNYSTNNVSSVKKATTLSTICPGAGQIYNRSYWKVPFVIGGFASMIYCIDWNNRGYQRFQKAYSLRYDYDVNPDLYPDGSKDEFKGRYSTSFLKNLKDSYRRNRDLCIIITAGLYILQIVDAHVDAHLKDYDISDDLSLNIEPMVNYAYVPTLNGHRPIYGFNVSLNF